MPQIGEDYTLPERDSKTRIQEILAGMAQPEPQPGFWASLLRAIPQALAVGVSENPGAALERQVATQFQQVQIEKQRRQRLKELGATIEIEDILERSKEDRREAAENRRSEREAKQREREFKASSKEQRAQLVLNNRFQKNRDVFQANETRLRDIRQNQANKDLTEFQANASRENQFFAEVSKNAIEAIMSGEMDAPTAVDLYSRLANKELPTKADVVTMNKAIRSQQAKVQKMALERIGAEAKARVEASGKSPQQAAQEFAFEFSQKTPMIWITDVDGQQKLIKRDVDPLTQQPALISGQTFIKEATPLEVQQYALSTYAQMKGFVPADLGVNVPSSTNKVAHAEGLIREAAKLRTIEQVKTDFLKPEIYQQKLGLTKGEADSIIQRIEGENKTEPEKVRDITLELEMGDTSALKAAQADVEKKGANARAAKIINDLNRELVLANESLKVKKLNKQDTKSIQGKIKDLESRLEVAYSLHPDLKPK